MIIKVLGVLFAAVGLIYALSIGTGYLLTCAMTDPRQGFDVRGVLTGTREIAFYYTLSGELTMDPALFSMSCPSKIVTRFDVEYSDQNDHSVLVYGEWRGPLPKRGETVQIYTIGSRNASVKNTVIRVFSTGLEYRSD